MTLLTRESPQPAPAGPGRTHALVIGVSSYPFADGPAASPQGAQLGLENLSSAAHSASRFAAWLWNEYSAPEAPLADLELLLSPSAGEELDPATPGIQQGDQQGVAEATRSNVIVALKGFRDRCAEHPENVAIVYVSGHGVQLTGQGALVLLNDVGDPGHLNLLDGALDVAGCQDAMYRSGSARTQFWFSDACRQRPTVARKFESLIGGISLDATGAGLADSCPLFLASSARQSAFAEIGGTTLFCQALLETLRGDGVAPPSELSDQWHVSTTQLIRLLPRKVRLAAAEHAEEQSVDVSGHPIDAVLQRFAQPPEVDLVVTLNPSDAAPAPNWQLFLSGAPTAGPGAPPIWPMRFRGPAGIYVLAVTPEAPWQGPGPLPLNASPPTCEAEIVVQQVNVVQP